MPRRSPASMAPVRRAILLLTALIIASAGLALVIPAESAQAAAGCERVPMPVSDLTIADGERKFRLQIDLAQNDLASIEATRIAAHQRLADFAAAAGDELDAFIDELVAWYQQQSTPCVAQGEGPYPNRPDRPDSASSPYGFGGVDVSPSAPPVVMVVTAPQHSTDAADAGVGATDQVVGSAPGLSAAPPLAHSGSESFVLAYFGAGLLAFGATALGMRRWMGATATG